MSEPLPDFYAELVAKIRARLIPDPEHPGCLVFPQKPGRHARIKWQGKLYSPHRVIAEWNAGRLGTRSTDTLHSCDNPPCANDNHVALGTRRDNVMDAIAKGRVKPPSPSSTGASSRTNARCSRCSRWVKRGVAHCRLCRGEAPVADRSPNPVGSPTLDDIRDWLAARRANDNGSTHDS